jgi:hypothetical protein
MSNLATPGFADRVAVLAAHLESALDGIRPERIRLATFGVLGLGLVARVLHLAGGRSFWLDEASLALNVRERSLEELAGVAKPWSRNASSQAI